MIRDQDVINVWISNQKPELPNLYFLLNTIFQLPKKDINKILNNMTPKQLSKIYENDNS